MRSELIREYTIGIPSGFCRIRSENDFANKEI